MVQRMEYDILLLASFYISIRQIHDAYSLSGGAKYSDVGEFVCFYLVPEFIMLKGFIQTANGPSF